MIQALQETSNKASRVVEVWLDSILEGYITEFVFNTNKPFSEEQTHGMNVKFTKETIGFTRGGARF